MAFASLNRQRNLCRSCISLPQTDQASLNALYWQPTSLPYILKYSQSRLRQILCFHQFYLLRESFSSGLKATSPIPSSSMVGMISFSCCLVKRIFTLQCNNRLYCMHVGWYRRLTFRKWKVFHLPAVTRSFTLALRAHLWKVQHWDQHSAGNTGQPNICAQSFSDPSTACLISSRWLLHPPFSHPVC